ncbi:nucleotidyltransferase family protein [Deinococcus caeni]|uniref:nucleotidyltransferase family protein n=1 Tax=Deinococcus caeni TaxID=569127 RepID=UPI003613A362
MNAAQPLFPDVRLDTVAGRLREVRAQWEALGVTRVQVFGSVARGEAGEASDIDLLIDFTPTSPRGLLDLMRARAVFERALGRRVDVVTQAALRPRCAATSWPTPSTCRTSRSACRPRTGRNAGAGGCSTC